MPRIRPLKYFVGANVENASYGHNLHFELTFRRYHLRRANSNRKGRGTETFMFSGLTDRLKVTRSSLQLALPRTRPCPWIV